MPDTPSNVVAIAQFFNLKGREALSAIRGLNDQDKQQLGDGIRNGTLTYN